MPALSAEIVCCGERDGVETCIRCCGANESNVETKEEFERSLKAINYAAARNT
jgi:hypothetical protein